MNSGRMYVHCKPCDHTWIAFALPMEAKELSKAMGRMKCPVCAKKKDIFLASKEQVMALEAKDAP